MENNGRRPGIHSPKSAEELLEIYFLDMRSALLETAATLDRIERAGGGPDLFRDPRIKNIREACKIIKDGKANRAEQFLHLFSEPVE